MTAKIIPFRRQELERDRYGRRHLTPEQRAQRSAMSKRPRRSKNGTPEERAAKAAATVGVEDSRERAGSAGEIRAQYHAAELCRLYGHLSMQERRVILDEMIKGLSPQ